MQSEKAVICQCSQKTIEEAIAIFQDTDQPYRKAKKLVTGCNKKCCDKPLSKLFDMVYFGNIDVKEILGVMEDEKKRLLDFF
jgi:hypothetical protein